MVEIWKDIEGFEGKYQISNFGEVLSLQYHRSKKMKVLSPKKHTKKGDKNYAYVVLSKNGYITHKKIHRLVAEYFIPNPHNKAYVNHIDGDIHNNRADNLEWVTPLENNLHAINILHKQSRKGFMYSLSKNNKPVAQIYVNEFGSECLMGIFVSAKAAADANKIKDATNIIACCKGKINSCNNYKWQYVDNIDFEKIYPTKFVKSSK